MTLRPALNSSRAMSGVMPKPPAAFSALPMTRSTPCSLTSRGTWRATVFRPGSPMMSPINRIFMAPLLRLFCDVGIPALPDHRHLDLAGVREFLFNFSREIAGEYRAFRVRNSFLLHDDADLASRLNRVGLLHSLVIDRQFFELLQALDVSLHGLATGAGAGGREGLRGRDKHSFRTNRLHLLVMCGNGIHDPWLFPIFLGEVSPDDRVRPFFFLTQRLPHVMHQRAAPRQLDVSFELGRHDAADIGRF